jgi:hypothetical protein
MKTIDKLINHSEVSEKAIERYLVKRVKAMGGICLKYSNPGEVGYPDRLCIFPNGVTRWVELKSKGEELRAIQLNRIARLLRMDHSVWVCDSKQTIDNLISSLGKDEV